MLLGRSSGAELVLSWCSSGAELVLSWRSSGAELAQLRCRAGAELAQLRCCYGAALAQPGRCSCTGWALTGGGLPTHPPSIPQKKHKKSTAPEDVGVPPPPPFCCTNMAYPMRVWSKKMACLVGGGPTRWLTPLGSAPPFPPPTHPPPPKIACHLVLGQKSWHTGPGAAEVQPGRC